MASALTSSVTVGTYLGTNSFSAAQITQAVNWANEAVENYCERTFAQAQFREWHKMAGPDLLLKQRPLDSTDGGIYSLHSGTKKLIKVVSARPVATTEFLQANFVPTSVVVTYAGASGMSTAGYDVASLTDISTAVALINASIAATTMSEENEGDPRSILPRSTINLAPSGTEDYLYGPSDPISTYEVDADAGIIKIGDSYIGSWVYVNYYGGYSTIPSELEQIATEMAAAMLRHDPGVQSERVGNTAFTYAGGGDIMSAFYSRLDRFRKRSIL